MSMPTSHKPTPRDPNEPHKVDLCGFCGEAIVRVCASCESPGPSPSKPQRTDWTTEAPTEPGWYWLRLAPGLERVVEVEADDNALWVRDTGRMHHEVAKLDARYQFLGPLTPSSFQAKPEPVPEAGPSMVTLKESEWAVLVNECDRLKRELTALKARLESVEGDAVKLARNIVREFVIGDPVREPEIAELLTAALARAADGEREKLRVAIERKRRAVVNGGDSNFHQGETTALDWVSDWLDDRSRATAKGEGKDDA